MAYTTIDNPELHFQCKTYTGNGSTQSITLDGSEDMQPDFVWIGNRGRSEDKPIYDSVRGATKAILSDTTAASETKSTGLTSFNSDGFSLGSDSMANYNNDTMVAWCFKGGGSASSNSNGSITSSVSANTTAGFSISTLDVGDTGNITFGHGLGAAPTFFWIKATSGTGGWVVYSLIVGNNKYLYLNSTDAAATSTSVWQNTAPTSAVIYTNSSDMQDDRVVVCHAFTPIKGFSKFGSYTGNNNSDGPFVYLGFKPAFLMIKRSSDGTNSWEIRDNKRDTFNSADDRAFADASAADDADNEGVDFLSNGFKIKNNGAGGNADGVTYIYVAFAEAPFVNSNRVPCNAR